MLGELLGLAGGQHALGEQALGVELAHRRVLANRAVHQGLCRRRFIGLVVAEAPVAHQVDDDVLAEFLPVAQRQARHEDHRFRVIRIHVQDRRFDHLRHVAAIGGRACVKRLAGGEAHLVVDHHVDRAAGAVAARLRHLQRLHDHALARECRVAVHQDRQDLLAVRIAAPLLARAHRPFRHRIDDLEVRRIEGQHDVHVTARGAQVGRKALVVLDVARPLIVPRLALEFREQVARRLAKHVDQHVQPAAMRHGDDGFLNAAPTALLHQVVEQRDQRLAALERKALLSHETRVQVTFESFGRGELPEYVAPLLGAEALLHATELELVLQPDALVGSGDMRELGADRAAIHLLEARQDFPKRGPLRDPTIAAPGKKFRVEIRCAESHVAGVKHARPFAFHQAERIDVGDQVPAVAKRLHQTRDRALLFAGGATVGSAWRVRRHSTRPLRRKRVEIRAPLGAHRSRVAQIGRVKILDKRSIAARQQCG